MLLAAVGNSAALIISKDPMSAFEAHAVFTPLASYSNFLSTTHIHGSAYSLYTQSRFLQGYTQGLFMGRISAESELL